MLAVAARSSSPSPRALASTGRRPVLVAVALPPRAAPPRAPLLTRAASAPRAPLPGPRVLAGALAAPAPSRPRRRHRPSRPRCESRRPGSVFLLV